MNDPNSHRANEDADELPPETFCRCQHQLKYHEPTDLAPCEVEGCDCEEFNDEPSAETLRSLNRGD